MTINERFTYLINFQFSGNKSAFAKKCGLSPTVIENIVGKRQGNPSYDVILKVCEQIEVNPDWLILEKGDIHKEPVSDKKILNESKPIYNVACKSDEANKGIPLISIEAMAGFGTGEMQVLKHECEHYVVPSFKEADFLITVKGSSMYPKYNSGDTVACKKLSLDNLFFQWNKVYVLDTEQGALIKRVKKSSDKEYITCVSDNTNYDPFDLHISQIRAIALVVGVIRLE